MADWAVEKDGASSCVSAVLLRVKGSALSSLETRKKLAFYYSYSAIKENKRDN